jgi:2-haloacid dehalogenase
MQRYQWLLFDADGTLFDYDKAERAALNQTFQSIGIAFDPGYLAAYRRIDQALWRELEQGKVTIDVLKVRRFEQLFEDIGVDYSPTQFQAQYQDALADCSELFHDAAEVVEALRKKYRLAILTNGLQAVQRRRFSKSVIRHHVEEIVISEEIGFAKPAREFFDATVTRLGTPHPRSLLMIGDSWTADIMGATQYGLDACWYNPEGKARPSGCEPTREIASLRELVDWL